MELDNKISFGKWEAVTLLVNLICTKLFLYYARMTVEDAGTAGWIMTLFSSLIVLIITVALLRLMRKFEGRDLIDIAETAGGKPLKIAAGLIITLVLLYMATTVLREFSEDMKVVSLPISPISYIMIFFLIGIITGSILGIEAIVRYHAIVVPVIGAGYLIILIGAIPQMDITNALPVLGKGAYEIFSQGLFKISVFGEILILFLLPPFLGNNGTVKKVAYATIGFSSFFLTAGSLAYILTFPYPSNLESFLPVYQMSRLINLGRFFQRIEAVFVFIWAMGAFLYLTAVFYFMVYAFAKTAGLKYLRPLILPFGIIVFSAAFLPQNLITVIWLNMRFFSKTAWLFTFVFVGVILAIASLRRGKGKEGAGG